MENKQDTTIIHVCKGLDFKRIAKLFEKFLTYK